MTGAAIAPVGEPVDGRMAVTDTDITTLAVDAIVNAANTTLAGGGGVDGAVHRAAGPALAAACRAVGRCPTGDAHVTIAGRLRARIVIHAVGPFWSGGGRGEAAKLASAWQAALRLAREHDCDTIAFPALSCGAYRFPHAEAASIAVGVLRDTLAAQAVPRRVVLALPDRRVRAAFNAALGHARAG